MHAFFTICFGVGVGFIVISFILGEVLGALDFDADIHMDGLVSPLKPSVLAAFLTVFGGTGMILVNRGSFLHALMFAGLLGLVVAFLFYRFIIVPLYRAQNTSTVAIQSLIGHDAKVSVKIPQGGFGKITYYVNGNTFTAPAKDTESGVLEQGQPVEIMYIEKSTYFVRRKEF